MTRLIIYLQIILKCYTTWILNKCQAETATFKCFYHTRNTHILGS